jgi:hypothetical protein
MTVEHDEILAERRILNHAGDCMKKAGVKKNSFIQVFPKYSDRGLEEYLCS